MSSMYALHAVEWLHAFSPQVVVALLIASLPALSGGTELSSKPPKKNKGQGEKDRSWGPNNKPAVLFGLFCASSVKAATSLVWKANAEIHACDAKCWWKRRHESCHSSIPSHSHAPYFHRATTGSSQKYRMTDRRWKEEGAPVTKRTSIPLRRQLNR